MNVHQDLIIVNKDAPTLPVPSLAPAMLASHLQQTGGLVPRILLSPPVVAGSQLQVAASRPQDGPTATLMITSNANGPLTYLTMEQLSSSQLTRPPSGSMEILTGILHVAPTTLSSLMELPAMLPLLTKFVVSRFSTLKDCSPLSPHLQGLE